MIKRRSEINNLIDEMARLPGLGPRSSRRLVLHLLKRKSKRMEPLAKLMLEVAQLIRECDECGNLSEADRCEICAAENRAKGEICVVADVADLWAMERAGSFKGRYHVLGGLLSMLNSMGPDEIRIPKLMERVAAESVSEVILALNLTVEGQTTAHYIAEQLQGVGVKVTSLGTGVPVGGELDYLDEGTIAAALDARKDV